MDIHSVPVPDKTETQSDWPTFPVGAQNSELAQYWLAAIIDSAEDAIISKTLDGRITSWNRGAERLFGYSPEEAIGQPVIMLIPPDHENEEPEILRRLRNGERIEHYETVRRRKNGELIDISLTVSPIQDSTGKIIGASKIARNITETKRNLVLLQQALHAAEEARREAERANRMKDDFLATISHELRTPLTAVMGWMRMLQDERLEASEISQALDIVNRNVKIQAQLVEDLLDISRIISGKMRLETRPLQLSPVINTAVESIVPAAEAKGIRLQIVTDLGVSSIMGDSNRLQQVLWNLLSNAVKFTPNGGRVQVLLEEIDGCVEVRVTDSGKGIGPEFLPCVFDRFAQEDSSNTRTHGGLGMGLAIVRYIVEMHGGTVQAKSEGEGKGATFIVAIPVMEKPVEEAPAIHADMHLQHESIAPHLPELDGLKLLVVDDEPDTCKMIETAFLKCGSVVRTADRPAGALAIIDEWQPDVIIADINMPATDGYQFIQSLRSRPPEKGGKTPAVALTAMTRIEDRAKALAAGFQMHVAKPVEILELRAIVASLASIVVKGSAL